MGQFLAPKITTASRSTLTLSASELVYDTDLSRFFGGDGTTVGGFAVGNIVGSGTANQITYFTASGTIASLSTTTYPSLTELSYVKGVTSAIQTQLNSKQGTLTLTTTGSSGSSTFISNVLNIPTYTLSGLGGQPLATNLTSLAGLSYVSTSFVKMTAAGTFTLDTTAYGTGTVTSVAALTLGTTGTDLSSTVANGTTTPVITLNVPTASATNRGALSSADWSTFNGKQGAITLTTTGTSGAATLVGNTLNIPQYSGGGGGGTVTSVSVTSANGFAGTVANATTTPAITLTTTVTGLLKGNGTAISAAVAGTDYLVSNQTITLSGDISGSGTTTISTSLATQAGVTTGTYNSATQITPITIDSKGRITNTGTTVTIAPLFSSIASKPTTLSGYGITDALSTSSTTSALTSFGTNPNLNNPLLTSISTVGGGGLEGGQINFARVTDGTGYWFIDSYGSTASPDLRIVESATERFKFGAGGAFYVGGSAGTSGQVLTSAGVGASPTWTSALTNPMTTAGDIIYGGVSGAATRLAGSGTNGWVLTYDTATNAPKWAASSGGGGMAIGGSITSATAGSVLFADTSGVLAQDNTNFFWNNTNKRLGIGTASPTTTLDVRGAFNFLNTGALTSTLQDVGTYTINSSGTTAVGFGMRLLLQGRVNTSDSQPFGYISPYIRYYSALPSSWGTGMNIAIYNNGSYINVINITGNSGGEVTITNGLTVGGQSYISANSLSHSTQIIGGFNNGQNSAITYRTTNAGSLLTSQGVFGLATVTAGNISVRLDNTNGLIFTAANGSSHIARAAIQITNLTNTAGSESGDLIFLTQSGGTAISEKMRIFAAGNVGINTGSTNGGYKFDVNGTGRFQNVLTTTGRVHANSRKTSAYTLTILDRIIFADLATAAFTITLPNHVAGTEYTIIKSDSTANLLTVNTTSGLINGVSTWTASAQYKFITVVSDGSNWLIVAGG